VFLRLARLGDVHTCMHMCAGQLLHSHVRSPRPAPRTTQLLECALDGCSAPVELPGIMSELLAGCCRRRPSLSQTSSRRLRETLALSPISMLWVRSGLENRVMLMVTGQDNYHRAHALLQWIHATNRRYGNPRSTTFIWRIGNHYIGTLFARLRLGSFKLTEH
jgi:hypothetical protein